MTAEDRYVEDRYVATRTIAAPTEKIFAVLADPTRHQHTEPGDWVRDAVDGVPITGTGQMFAVNMYFDARGGHYVMHNVVTEFEPNTTIAWLPGRLDESGRHEAGGWTWRYDLVPVAEGTDVTLTYDWSATPQAVLDAIGGLPPFPREYVEKSLAALEDAVR